MAAYPPVQGGAGAMEAPPSASPGPTGPLPTGPGGAPGMGGMGGGDQAQSARRAVLMMGAEIDRALVAVAQAIQQSPSPDGLDELAQGRAMIEAGIAKFVAAGGAPGGQGAPSTSPTETGMQFPGGGMGSGQP